MDRCKDVRCVLARVVEPAALGIEIEHAQEVLCACEQLKRECQWSWS